MRTVLVSLLIAVAFLPACEDEEVVGGCDLCPPPGKTFQPLTTRENVLNNLELSYTQQKHSPYDELLDPNFTFFFSPGDVGGNIPAQWGRVEELQMATLLFDRTLNQPPYPTCRSIRMNLEFESGVVWVDTIPAAFPAETWYTTTAYYDFTVEMDPDITYIAVPGSQAQLTVRNAGTDDAPQWRLVKWRDLASNSVASQRSASTETLTWGAVKALYR